MTNLDVPVDIESPDFWGDRIERLLRTQFDCDFHDRLPKNES